jgi:beta-galactosidase/beta-glucuronidase
MNRIRQVRTEVHRLSAVEAEVWILIETDETSATTEVRGRLVGPRCPGTSTIEVAYPLRPIPHGPENTPKLSRRVNIPDPSLWAPDRPFVYHAVIELWEDGEFSETAEFDYGLRMVDSPTRHAGGNS